MLKDGMTLMASRGNNGVADKKVYGWSGFAVKETEVPLTCVWLI